MEMDTIKILGRIIKSYLFTKYHTDNFSSSDHNKVILTSQATILHWRHF